jgi:hypothetical protein
MTRQRVCDNKYETVSPKINEHMVHIFAKKGHEQWQI